MINIPFSRKAGQANSIRASGRELKPHVTPGKRRRPHLSPANARPENRYVSVIPAAKIAAASAHIISRAASDHPIVNGLNQPRAVIVNIADS